MRGGSRAPDGRGRGRERGHVWSAGSKPGGLGGFPAVDHLVFGFIAVYSGPRPASPPSADVLTCHVTRGRSSIALAFIKYLLTVSILFGVIDYAT